MPNTSSPTRNLGHGRPDLLNEARELHARDRPLRAANAGEETAERVLETAQVIIELLPKPSECLVVLATRNDELRTAESLVARKRARA